MINAPSNTTGEEVTISINPVNPHFISAASNINYFYSSSDSGLTWSQSQIHSTFGVFGDPCLVYDGLGNLYYAHLSDPPSGNPPGSGYLLDRIVVQKSTDNGVTWNNGAGIGLNPPKDQDKEWMAADLSSSKYKNDLYISWTEFDKYGSRLPQDSSRILFSRSTDHGNSWSKPVRVSDTGGNCVDSDSTVEGAVPCVGPDGEVYISWGGPLGIMFDKSLDGGKTFGKDKFAASQVGGWDYDVSGIYRSDGFPITMCDTGNSPYRGNIYILWGDKRNGEENADVFIIKSTDKGESWGNVVKVNNDSSAREQFFPWACIDQSTGNIYALFYDRRDTKGDATDLFLARSTDGGNTFQNLKISDSSFVPIKNVFFGDYINVAASNKKIYPIWMRLDSTKLSIWTALINENETSVGMENRNKIITGFNLYQNYPDPFNPATVIKYSIPSLTHVSLKVYDILGKEIASLVDEEKKPGIYTERFNAIKTDISSGVYIYRLTAGKYSMQRKMVVLK